MYSRTRERRYTAEQAEAVHPVVAQGDRTAAGTPLWIGTRAVDHYASLGTFGNQMSVNGACLRK